MSSATTRAMRTSSRRSLPALSRSSLRGLPTEVLRLHLDRLNLVATGRRDEQICRLQEYLRANAGADPESASGSSEPDRPAGGAEGNTSTGGDGNEETSGDAETGSTSTSASEQDSSEPRRHPVPRRHTTTRRNPPPRLPTIRHSQSHSHRRGRSDEHHTRTTVSARPPAARRHQRRQAQRHSSPSPSPPPARGSRKRRSPLSGRRAQRHSLSPPPPVRGSRKQHSSSRRRARRHSSSPSPLSPSPVRRSHKRRLSPRRRAQRHFSSPSLSPPPVRRSRKQRRSSSSSSLTSPSSSLSPDRHHRHRCCNRRQRHHHSPSSDSDDWAPSSAISCAPPPSHRLARRIKRGKYVNFDSLLLPPLPVGPVPSKARANRIRDKRSVTDLASWLEAWNRYLCVRLSAQPSLALELSTYQTTLAMLFSHYPAMACIRYDQLFRQATGRDRSLRWDVVREDLHVWCFTRRPISPPPLPERPLPERRPQQSFRDRPTITSRLGPPPPTPTHVFRTATGHEICRRYNGGYCPRGEECTYAHACWTPGCHGPHPGKDCPKRST